MLRILHLTTCYAGAVSLRLGHTRGENNTQLFSKTLVPLRYLKGKPFRHPFHRALKYRFAKFVSFREDNIFPYIKGTFSIVGEDIILPFFDANVTQRKGRVHYVRTIL